MGRHLHTELKGGRSRPGSAVQRRLAIFCAALQRPAAPRRPSSCRCRCRCSCAPLPPPLPLPVRVSIPTPPPCSARAASPVHVLGVVDVWASACACACAFAFCVLRLRLRWRWRWRVDAMHAQPHRRLARRPMGISRSPQPGNAPRLPAARASSSRPPKPTPAQSRAMGPIGQAADQ